MTSTNYIADDAIIVRILYDIVYVKLTPDYANINDDNSVIIVGKEVGYNKM
jgi:hypothetical protein